MSEFDAIIIGTGAAGQTVAAELAGAGKRVAIVDEREYGGTCALRGCEPKKVMVQAAEVVERAARQQGNGVVGDVTLDWPALVAFKKTFTDPTPQGVEDYLQGLGVATLHGVARFTGPASVAVGDQEHTAETIVVASGARPRPLGIPGEDLVLTSEQFMAAERLGRRVVFLGGGFVSMEFAPVARAAGAHVTVVHRGAHVLKEFDPDLSDLLVKAYREAGMDVLLNAPVDAVERDGDALAVVLGGGERVPADMVVHGAGRVPDLGELDLAAAGVTTGRHGVEVDEHLRSLSNPHVWAVGDAASRGLPLTPVATIEGAVAAANILGGDRIFDPAVTPSVTFTDPPLAGVGLSEAQAAARGLDVSGGLVDMSAWASTRRIGARVAGAKVLVEKASGRLAGAHLLGHHAEDVINVFAVAMTAGLTVSDLMALPWAYPTAEWEIRYLV
jgi:glutathione reductase (NADPH)